MSATDIKRAIKERYGAAARGKGLDPSSEASCCATPSCCGTPQAAAAISKAIGYSDDELGAVPEGANLGLGCGNPTALASIREGDTVLDLGSGPGFDCFLAAPKVGTTGRVIGVDMTPGMIERARENARKGNYGNVEFRLGDIENLPVEDSSVDLVISNCVINLSPDKAKAFKEAYRTLKPGGSLTVSDIVLLRELPETLRNSSVAYAGCVAGAMLKDDYLQAIRNAGFEDVEVTEEVSFPIEFITTATDPTFQHILAEEENMTEVELRQAAASVRSVKVRATRPALA